MYRYDEFDRTFLAERVAEFREQTRRFLAGELSEDEFRPLRLQNGLYVEKHAPMLRVAIPYGLLSSRQLRKLAHIARAYDRGERCDMEAGMAKYFATESAMENALEAMRIHGGYGYSKEYAVERIYRDVRLLTIGEGTSEVQRMVIGRGVAQG